LGPAALERALFPIGDLTKEEVRGMARELGLAVADKRESQDICFVEGKRYLDFLRERFPERLEASPQGEVKDSEGRPLRRHDGIHAFTIGQRRGVQVAAGERLYVSDIDVATGTVTVDREAALWKQQARIARVSYTEGSPPAGPIAVQGKIRYLHAPAPALLTPAGEGLADVRFDAPQRAMTPGQSLVLYDFDRVVAGGLIERVG
jgi:tRNA-specific 2-thiouridylase